MKLLHEQIPARTQLLLLLACIVILAALSFLPKGRLPLASAETNFVEKSLHGLGIVPASCASSPAWFHSALAGSGDPYGYIVYNGQTEIGAYAPYAGMYVCVYFNSSGNNIFIPAATAAELQSFKNSPPGSVAVY